MGSLTLKPDIAIPEKYRHELEYAKVKDGRTYEEIYAALASNDEAPITSEKIIWGFWHAGFAKMPAWTQRNVVDWQRINPDWSIHILDNIPESPHYALKYVTEDMLPESFIQRTMDGPFTGPHAADLLRGACLYKYGGVWLDVGAILTRDMDRICWNTLSDPTSPLQVAAPHLYDQAIVNSFIAARKGSPFIKRW
jgi:mannosyltransferase OCH1-like enzyme